MKSRSWMLKVWEPPVEDRDYVIGGDPAGGMSNSDWSVAHVLKPSDMKIVAVVRDKIDPDQYGKMIEALAYAYNTARVCIERNRDGQAVNNFLMNRGYPNLHYSKEFKIRGNQQDARPGLYTGRSNKMEIIAVLQGLVHDEMLTIPHKETLDELGTFVKDEKGMGQAQQGFNDDCVMSLACCVFANAQFGDKKAYRAQKKSGEEPATKKHNTMHNPHRSAFSGNDHA